MNLGKAIRLCRIQKQLSQAELASIAGVSVSYLSLLENNKRDPNLSTMTQIADALEVPLSILVYLAMDGTELKAISSELAEKLAYLALNLVRTSGSEHSDLQGA